MPLKNPGNLRKGGDKLPHVMCTEAYWLSEGEQSRITPLVRAFADQFPGKTVEDVRGIIKDISRFKRVRMSEEQLQDAYSKRTADEIMESREIFVIKRRGRQAPIQVNGCIDYNVALCAVLRAKGILSKFIRVFDHSVTFAKIEGRWHEIDLMKQFEQKHKAEAIQPLEGKVIEQYEHAKKHEAYAEGLDAWDIGIRGLNDFGRYLK
jgi:hypothetical protein